MCKCYCYFAQPDSWGQPMGVIELNELLNLKGVRIVHINARSLYNKLDDITNTFHQCDIIVITETWLTNVIPTSSINIGGFTVIRQDRHINVNKKGGGICIYVKNSFMFDRIDEICNVSPDCELMGIRVKMGYIKPCYILGVYRPPTGNMSKFMDGLNVVLNDLDLTKTELFILGDINIDYKSSKLCKKLKVKNFETKFNIRQLIDTYTRITNTTSTLLDWIYTSADYISDCGVVNYNISDHLPTFVIRKKKRNKIKKITITGRSYLRYDKDTFHQLLSESNWETFDRSDDPEIMWDIMEENIINVLDGMCPIRKLVVPESKPDGLNDDIIQLMRKRDTTYREARKKKDPVTWRKATFLRNRVEMAIKNSKRDKIQRELHLNRNNPKKFWENISSVISNDKVGNIQGLIDDNGNLVQEGQELSELINMYFVNIGKTLANDIITKTSEGKCIPLTQGPANSNKDGICNIAVLEQDITRILKTTRLDKASAIPNIRTMVIVHAFYNQIERITKMYNGPLTLCTFPRKWKKATSSIAKGVKSKDCFRYPYYLCQAKY